MISAATQEEVDEVIAHATAKRYHVLAVTPRRRSLEEVVLESAQEQRREQHTTLGSPQRRSA